MAVSGDSGKRQDPHIFVDPSELPIIREVQSGSNAANCSSVAIASLHAAPPKLVAGSRTTWEFTLGLFPSYFPFAGIETEIVVRTFFVLVGLSFLLTLRGDGNRLCTVNWELYDGMSKPVAVLSRFAANRLLPAPELSRPSIVAPPFAIAPPAWLRPG